MLMLTANAAWPQATSALGVMVFMAATADSAEEKETWHEECPKLARYGPEALSRSSRKVRHALPTP